MTILLLGSSGFIGRQVRLLLEQMGHDLRLPSHQQVDFMNLDVHSDEQNLTELLMGVDVVINMVGIMSNDAGKLEPVHHYSPVRLAKLAKSLGVKRWVNLSALGAECQHSVAFLATKGRGDKALQQLADNTFSVAIARPSLIFGRTGNQYGASCALFIKLAKLPVLCLPNAGKFYIQPVHVNEVAMGLVRLATFKPHHNDATSTIINFTGKTTVTLADYLQAIRQTIHQKPPSIIINVPMAWAKMGMALIKPLNLFNSNSNSRSNTMLSQDSLTLLQNGSVADYQPFAKLLRHEPMGYEEFLTVF
ncbi:NAD-dependent epimerase/dehydratase family protein [Psychrobacter sp. I-STPA10]|uniref:NAD-dependent epimerase/dehydratase family protein n=1 Tax=Psychrobacter sp. I-STPA10 TaxID=2585769 RepID=UPI001E4F84A8|nr:NAD-dependent epimerase/dehydratase family protein [Psychrobacter sp. I-STPA10]